MEKILEHGWRISWNAGWRTLRNMLGEHRRNVDGEHAGNMGVEYLGAIARFEQRIWIGPYNCVSYVLSNHTYR